MKLLRTYAHRVSSKADDFLISHAAKSLNLWTGCGYPRSGTTWVCRLLSSYLDLPWAKKRALPAVRSAVIHSHLGYHAGLSNCFYSYRDGRDIMVSQYFNRVRLTSIDDHPAGKKWQKIFTDLYGPAFAPSDARSNLPKYLEFSLTNPRGSRLTWPQHIAEWVQPQHRNVAQLRYEDLLEDTFGPMSKGLAHFLDEPVDEARLRAAIDKVSFAKWTGRQPGEVAQNNFFRKGVAGDWRNHFTKEAAEIFVEHAGDTLIKLGYEQDNSWIESCSV